MLVFPGFYISRIFIHLENIAREIEFMLNLVVQSSHRIRFLIFAREAEELIFFHIAAEANAITHPNRYLLIATSGGLNQQRTGVISLACIFLVEDFVFALLFTWKMVG